MKGRAVQLNIKKTLLCTVKKECSMTFLFLDLILASNRGGCALSTKRGNKYDITELSMPTSMVVSSNHKILTILIIMQDPNRVYGSPKIMVIDKGV